jgi:NifB/MoaA-like Fe-S oxidoreductase
VVPTGTRSGFFAAVDGAPAEGYRAPRGGVATVEVVQLLRTRGGNRPIGIITGEMGARVLAPLVPALGKHAGTEVRLVPIANRFFGGNIAVTGLLTGADVAAALADEPAGHRYLLPDVMLSRGSFLDGETLAVLPRPVEVVATDGAALVRALSSS